MACAFETPISESCVPQMGEIQVNSELVDEKYQEQTVSVLQNLNNKLNDLKRVHTALRDEVKDITANPFPSFEALKDLSTQHELLKKRYLDECSERKRLYNEVIELKGNIRVFCRCRPLNPNEIANGSTSVVDFDLSQENEIQIVSSDSTRKQFRFDHVFKPEDGQEAVFAETMPIVTSVLDGFNVCIFAYGQTGTGKTFTMEGTPENRGVNYRTLEKLFSSAKQRSSIMKYELFVSMLEVYNDKIRDLLIEKCNQPAKKVEVKLSAEGTQEVQGLREIPVYGTDDVWELLQSGSRARSVGSTCANELSSRSHCLLRLTVIGENLVNAQRTRSHLWLVDLAGSERVGRIEAEGERLKESQFINKSLSALGDVISALAAKMAHVPYRNSKLTHILQSSLGADCKTVMFVQISPSLADLGETLCSLNFASRVRGVEHGPARKLADLTEISKNKQLAEKSKHDEREMKKLQDSVQSLQLRLSAREHTCKNLQQKVLHLENKLVEEKKKQLKLKQENRVSAAVSNQSSSALPSLNQTRMMVARTERKPPLALRPRLPLQKITHLVPQQPSSVHPRRSLLLPTVYEDKENAIMASKANTDVKARQDTHAIKSIPPQATNLQVKQPTRRASMATLRPPESGMIIPAKNSAVCPRNDHRSMGRQSFVWDPQRVWCTSKVLSPKLEDEKSSAAAVLHEAPPVVPRCSKPLGSPRLPAVVALQKKRLVWSPLKMKAYAGLKARRVSHAIKPTLPQATTLQVKKQPMRRASLATLLPQESDSIVSPGKSSIVRSRNNHRSMGRQSYVWDPQRVWRKSRVLSPQQEEDEETTSTAALVEATPLGPKCSNSVGSPPSQQPGSWRPKHPTVVALQKKLLWSDLKMKENTGSKARRVSYAIRLTPPQAKNRQVKQPLRRASLATLHPTESCMITPAKSSIVNPENDYRSRGRQSFVWDPQRMRRTSRLFSPPVEEEKPSAAAAALVVDTPVSSSCSKVMESPCSQQAGSWWRPKLPTVIELPKKQLVWSPLKMKVMQSSNKNSFLAS